MTRHILLVTLAGMLALAGGQALADEAQSSGVPLTQLNGDANGDQSIDVSDAVYLLGYLYSGGAAPVALGCGRELSIWLNGDVNGSWEVDISDAVWLLGFLYSGGAAPIASCDFEYALGTAGGGGGGGNPNPGILPPNSRPHGKSYGEWNRAWWEWSVAIPKPQNPTADPTGAFCDQGQSGSVWFLAGNFGGTTVRSCTVSSGKTLFFPILNTVASKPFRGNTEDELRAFALKRMHSATRLECTIDGVPVEDIPDYLADSKGFDLVVPPDNVIGRPPGIYLSVAAGYSLMVTPLPPGEHLIHFASAMTFPGPFALDVTYHLTVVPGDGS